MVPFCNCRRLVPLLYYSRQNPSNKMDDRCCQSSPTNWLLQSSRISKYVRYKYFVNETRSMNRLKTSVSLLTLSIPRMEAPPIEDQLLFLFFVFSILLLFILLESITQGISLMLSFRFIFHLPLKSPIITLQPNSHYNLFPIVNQWTPSIVNSILNLLFFLFNKTRLFCRTRFKG